jgi:hypothetical protein
MTALIYSTALTMSPLPDCLTRCLLVRVAEYVIENHEEWPDAERKAVLDASFEAVDQLRSINAPVIMVAGGQARRYFRWWLSRAKEVRDRYRCRCRVRLSPDPPLHAQCTLTPHLPVVPVLRNRTATDWSRGSSVCPAIGFCCSTVGRMIRARGSTHSSSHAIIPLIQAAILDDTRRRWSRY